MQMGKKQTSLSHGALHVNNKQDETKSFSLWKEWKGKHQKDNIEGEQF